MSRRRREPTWLFLAILVGLFILSAVTPILWRPGTGSRSTDGGVANGKPDAAASLAGAVAPRPAAVSCPAIAPTPAPIATAPEAVPSENVSPAERTASKNVDAEIAELEFTQETPASEPELAPVNEMVGSQAPAGDPMPVQQKPEATLEAVSEAPARSQAANEETPIGKAFVWDSEKTPEMAAEPEKVAVQAIEPEKTVEPAKAIEPEKVVEPEKAPEPEKAVEINATAPRVEVAKPSRWQEPTALIKQLDELVGEPAAAGWAAEVKRLIADLGTAISDDPDRSLAVIANLDRLREQGDSLASQVKSIATASKVRRAGFAMARRVALWRQLARAASISAAEQSGGDPERLDERVRAVDELFRDAKWGAAWARYLKLDALQEAMRDKTPEGRQRYPALARALLNRLLRMPLNDRQRQLVATGPLAALCQELRPWAVEPIDVAELLRHLERYEQSGLAADARLVAEDFDRLEFSGNGSAQTLAHELDGKYGNANLRVVLSRDLLNRLVPPRPLQYGEVNDVLGGHPVHGQSVTSAKVSVRLVPDTQHLRMALEVNGLVSALTHSTAGPATFYNDSQSTYRAWKEMLYGAAGLEIKPAEVAVGNNTELRHLETDFEWIPLIGYVAKQVARNQYDQQKPQMSYEVEEKIGAQAIRQVDDEAGARFAAFSRRLHNSVLDPLTRLSLGPAIVSAETSTERMALRVRLAAEAQLGGHTPRPQAPADSLASVQIHETALNNLVHQLDLDGQTMTLPELRQRLAQRLNRPEIAKVSSEHDDLSITFARQDAASVRLQNGQVIIALCIARLSKSPYSWDNFRVEACYHPEPEGRSADLVRHEVIHLTGQRLTTRSQVALRGIFGTAFSENHPLKLTPDAIVNDPRLAGLAVTQFVVEDGWVALAIGRELRTAKAPRGPIAK
jgi:hypothetical protein